MKNEPQVVVGVDIGGTKVAAGLVNAEGEILARNRTPMLTTGAPSKLSTLPFCVGLPG
jgi:predicted NBD/HSP70 family sugar kinase